jgi:creatinine amidohydrolase
MSKLTMCEMTSPQLRDAGRDPQTIGLIPTAAVEQHGPHLPVGTDAIIADHLATVVAERLSVPVLVAPVVPAGISQHHLAFPGTVHLPEEAFATVVGAYVSAMARLGIRRIAIFSSHGGNFACLGRLAAERTASGEATVVAFADLGRYAAVMSEGALRTGLSVPDSDIHAGGLETSQMLHLWGGERLPFDAALEGYTAAEPGWLDRMFADGVAALSENGILGRPAGATAAAGDAIFAALADELTTWIADALPPGVPAALATGHAGND